ncbi:L-dopachrome tautomerase yellow-f2-like isoform X2 [Choristoneura fumiferana]|uniref:L-dopachrome tautomerase yellow-f2-like isoform X2 n=1 Tax=Choristoneura fumiferana TaxID=7141 RepID=UPI003D15EC75
MVLRLLTLNLLSSLFLVVKCENMSVVFSWKQISYNFDGILYTKSSDYDRSGFDIVHFADDLDDPEKFFIQYNNVPIGFEQHGDRVFVTVPRRRHGIPSTLNYVKLSSAEPILQPYPDVARSQSLISVYRPRVDECGRLWMVDTGMLEVPGERKQVQPPAIVVFDLSTNRQVLRHELKPSVLVDERTPAGLTSITLDVDPRGCGDAYAYITDLATSGLIVFSMRDRDSWRIEHDSFKLDESAMNFTVAGHIISWRDGLFSMALSGRDAAGRRTAFFHPLVSTQEFSIDTEYLKTRAIGNHVRLLGTRGPLTQSGSHDYHNSSKTLFFGNVAQDGILCWRTDKPLTMNVVLVAQDREKLVYISDLKVKGDEVWVLANQIPRFVYSVLDPSQNNFFLMKAKVQDLIRSTKCYS